MRLRFDIEKHEEVYEALVDVLGFDQECFLTDDCIEILDEDFRVVKNLLPKIEFEII